LLILGAPFRELRELATLKSPLFPGPLAWEGLEYDLRKQPENSKFAAKSAATGAPATSV
jgi:hypothetical protein